jgi:hypothetical protein
LEATVRRPRGEKEMPLKEFTLLLQEEVTIPAAEIFAIVLLPGVVTK